MVGLPSSSSEDPRGSGDGAYDGRLLILLGLLVLTFTDADAKGEAAAAFVCTCRLLPGGALTAAVAWHAKCLLGSMCT